MFFILQNHFSDITYISG